jgi:hypothetical protein
MAARTAIAISDSSEVKAAETIYTSTKKVKVGQAL